MGGCMRRLTISVFGSTTHYSDDMGETWKQSPAPPRFSRPSASGRPGGTPKKPSARAADTHDNTGRSAQGLEY